MSSRSPEDLVREAIRQGVTDPGVIEALRRVPREGFVPPESARMAYLDRPVPIPGGQVTSQPSLVARMVEALELEGDDRVLEVGTGYGFQTALLALLAGRVWSVERHPELAAAARRNLAREGIENVEVVVGDGSEGLPEHAPYDAILVSAAFPEVPPPLREQLRTGGRLVQPIGPGGREEVVSFERTSEGLERREVLTGARFVRLYGRHGYPDP